MPDPTLPALATDAATLLALVPAPLGPILVDLAKISPDAVAVVQALAHLRAGQDPTEIRQAIEPSVLRALEGL
jgi:hypothetical protein